MWYMFDLLSENIILAAKKKVKKSNLFIIHISPILLTQML